MYTSQLIFWFITYSILIASTAIAVTAVPSGMRRRYRPVVMTNLSILLIVVSVSLVLFRYSLNRLDAGGWGGFFLQLLFYIGLSSVSWFGMMLPSAVFQEMRAGRQIGLFKVLILVFLLSELISSIVVRAGAGEIGGAVIINGIFQLGILALFFLALVSAVIRIAVEWKGGSLWLRIAFCVLCIVLILAVLSIDVAYGIWSKIRSERELSLFYIFPVFLTVFSIFLAGFTVFSVRRKITAEVLTPLALSGNTVSAPVSWRSRG